MNCKRFLCHLTVVCLLIGVFPVALQISSGNASAAPDTHTWDGGGADAFAGTHANWVTDIAPEAGDSVIFNAGALPCTWNLSISLNSFSMNASYAGTVTATVWFNTTGDIVISSGTFAFGSVTVGCGGNFDSRTGTITYGTGTLRMDTTGKMLTTSGALVTGAFANLILPSGTTTALSNIVIAYGTLTGSASILDLSTSGKQLTIYWRGIGNNLQGSGAISSTLAIIWFVSYASISNFNQGSWTIDAPVTLVTDTTHSTISLSADLSINGTFIFYGWNWAKAILWSNSHAIQSTNVQLNAWGFLYGNASTITCSRNWDSSLGAFTAMTSNIVMTGASNTLKTNDTNGALYDLQISGNISTLSSLNVTNNLTIDTGKTLTMASGKTLTVDNLTVGIAAALSLMTNSYTRGSIVNNGAISQNSKWLNITGSSSTPLTGYGTFDGNLGLNGSSASSYQVQTGLPMGYLHTDRDTIVSISPTQYLRATPASTEFVNVSIKSYGTEAGRAARWSADSTGPVTYTIVASANQLYDIWVDQTTRIGAVQTSSDGIVQFTYNGPFSSHEFTVSKSAGPGNNVQSAFEYVIDGNLVTFTDKSYGGATVWIWSFGDGTGSTKQNPTHKYYSSGTYQVSLTVYDSEGKASIAKTNIEIVLGPDNPIERSKQGWNVYVTEDLTLSITAIGLVIGGGIMYVSAIFLPAIPIITPKGRKLLGALMVIAGICWFVFIDNTHSLLGWGSV